jgi:tetratricopeptide (TPR) repeat protein
MPSTYYCPRGKVEILLSRGYVLYHIGEAARALQDAGRALDLAKRFRLLKDQAESLMMLASVHDQLNQMEAMLQEAMAALDLFCRLGDRYGECQATGQLGIATSSLEGYAAARPYYARALEIARTLGDPHNLYRCLLEMGWILIRTKEYEIAKRHLEEGLEMAGTAEDSSQVAFGTSCLGEIAMHQGRPEEALALHQRALAIREKIGDTWFQAITWSWLSGDWRALGDLAKAKEARERSLAINRAIGIRSAIVHDLGLLAEICEIRGELDLAFAYCREALDFCRRYDQTEPLSFLFCRLGSVHFSQGEWKDAGAAAREALSRDTPVCEKALAVLVLARLALVQGDLILAFGRLREAEGPATSSDDSALLFDLHSAWADFHLVGGDASLLRKDLEALHALLPEQKGKHVELRMEVLAACLLACEGDVGEAETVFANALSPLQEMGLRWEEARAGLRFGKALGREKGLPYLKKAQVLFSEIGAAGWAGLCEQAPDAKGEPSP